jgi:hypothetical protein
MLNTLYEKKKDILLYYDSKIENKERALNRKAGNIKTEKIKNEIITTDSYYYIHNASCPTKAKIQPKQVVKREVPPPVQTMTVEEYVESERKITAKKNVAFKLDMRMTDAKILLDTDMAPLLRKIKMINADIDEAKANGDQEVSLNHIWRQN